MIELKSKCFKLVSTILIATSQIACSPGDKKENKEHTSTIVDTLNYEKEDYDSMRAYYSADSLLLSTLNKRIEVGDTNSMKMKQLLTTEYESRDQTGMTESEIDVIILSYYTSKKVIEGFKKISSGLPNASDSRKKTDSMLNALEKFKKELLELSGQHTNDTTKMEN